jgi:SecD/SecF fusion protein
MIGSSELGYSQTNDSRICKMLLYSRNCMSREQLALEKMERDRLQREGKSDEEINKLADAKKYEYFVLTRISPEDSVLVGGDISLTAAAGTDQKTSVPCIEFTLNEAGAEQFGKLTRRNKPSGGVTRSLAIILDDRVLVAPTIQGEITSRGQINGKFDRKTVDRMVQILRSGALNAELRELPVSENTIEPKFGADAIRRGTNIAGLALVPILAFMIIYFCLGVGRWRRSRPLGSSGAPK